MLNKKTIDHIQVKDKKVLVRCDFNVPIIDGKITDINRLEGAIPTIKKLVSEGAKVVLCSHLGKPNGEVKPELSLAPVARKLTEMLGQSVVFAADNQVVSDETKVLVSDMKAGQVVLLENTRYRSEETKNNVSFSKDLASLSDVFVNDAFGTAHRTHCSNVGVTDFIDTCAVGYLMQKEVEYIAKALEAPKRPFVAILGGAKVFDKIGVISNLLEKVDTLIVGGGMAYTFLKALGNDVGMSLLEEDKMGYALEMIEKAAVLGVEILLPADHVIAKEFKNDTEFKVVPRGGIHHEWEGMDIGPTTIENYVATIKEAKTVIWNGPMGVFEFENFSKGTKAVAETLAATECMSIIGGGDSAAAVNQFGFGEKMSHVSTGGGASLVLLEGFLLPGLEAVDNL